MTDEVSKLKQLLFDREAATLTDLERRIALVAEAERRTHGELSQRIDELNRRAGSPAAMRASVAEVLDDAIVEARETRHDLMTRAVAPLVVKTIQTELRNSQDAMVEALYPITGRLVKAYVASAMKDMMNQMNRRLEMNPMMLRFRSLVSGYSMAELALAETQRLEVEELYLIQRGTGALIQRWPESRSSSRSNADIHMSGVITAINDFAGHAFQESGGNLRSFDLDDAVVFLRASPVHLLAAKCRGAAVSGVEQMLDQELLDIVSRLQDAPAGAPNAGVPADLLVDLKQRLEAGIGATHERLARAGLPFHPLKALAAIVLLALLAGGGAYAYTVYEREMTRMAAQDVLDRAEDFKGYPVQLEAGWRGRILALSGIAPSAMAKDAMIERLHATLPEVELKDGLAVLPGAQPDPRPQIAAVRRDLGTLEAVIARRGIRRALDRAAGRLEQSMPELERLTQLRDAPKRTVAERARTAIAETTRGLDAQRRALQAVDSNPAAGNFQAELRRLAGELQKVAADLAVLVGDGGAPRPAAIRAAGASSDPAEAAEEVGLAAERLATIATAAAQVSAIRIPEPVPPSQPTPLERLQAFARTNAIFFGNADEYRFADKAEATMDELTRLMRQNSAIVRVVGYTDERGGSTRNSPLSQSRADKVMQALLARGLPRERLSALGRPNGPDLSVSVGPASPNRRVEFEVGFEGETAAGP